MQNPDTRYVPLSSLGVATENVRYGQPADANVPDLAETLLAAGNVVAIICRPGQKGEPEFCALDGRRRYLGFKLLEESGRIPSDHPVQISILTDPAQIAAATILTNSEREPLSELDLVNAIAKIRAGRRKMSAEQVATALGYPVTEIRRLQGVASLPQEALDALAQGKLRMAAAREMVRLATPEEQLEYTRRALIGHDIVREIRSLHTNGATDLSDRRLRLVTLPGYIAAGGRVTQDLFGELPDRLDDPEILQNAWAERMQPLVDRLTNDGALVSLISSFNWWRGPEGTEKVHRPNKPEPDLAEAIAAADAQYLQVVNTFHATDDATPAPSISDEMLTAHLDALLHVFNTISGGREIGAVEIFPDKDFGANYTFYARVLPVEESDDTDDSQDDDTTCDRATEREVAVAVPDQVVETEDFSHKLHSTYTDLATRGLIVAVADDPTTALVFNIATLFTQVAFTGWEVRERASCMKAERYDFKGRPELDGQIIARIEERKTAYKASGLRPIPWVASLSHGERMALMAELTALTINLHEGRTDQINKGARAEAAELAEMTGYSFTNYATPDLDFYAAHKKSSLLEFIEEMNGDTATAATLKKDDLAVYTAELSAQMQWAPSALSLQAAEPKTDDQPSDDSSEGNDDPTDTIDGVGSIGSDIPDVQDETPLSQNEELAAAA